ncbi:MAG: iron dicitrate transport regulator FecR [Planctomycetia bacterium]|nr:iron dicitrate transport regulator FecR [Planctomycetia bacterium]
MPINPETLDQAAKRLRGARRLVVFTGAGVSAESGIPTFRDDNGFWQRFPPEQFARWDGLIKTAVVHPDQLAEFLQAVLEPIAVAWPNAAHAAIARLEQHCKATVITQNVDGLHQAAGSKQVREVHGSFFRVVSLRGQPIRSLQREELVAVSESLRRTRSGMFRLARLLWSLRPMFGLSWRGFKRPGVVLFGGAMAEPDWSQAQRDAQLCDAILVVGTSGLIYPAAMLPGLARQHGASVISIDPYEPGPSHVWLRGRAGEVVPQLVQAAFG